MGICSSVENGYNIPEIAPIELVDIRQYECNAKERNGIFCVLVDVLFTKVMQYTSSNYILEKMKNIYEKDKKVKKANMQTFWA